MKKIFKNKKYTEIAIYVIVTAFLLMVLWRLVNSTENLWNTLSSALSFLTKSFSTVLGGLILGYILTPAAENIEKLMLKIFKKKRSVRAKERLYSISVFIVFIILILLIVLLITFVVPPLVDNIVQLGEAAPEYVEDILDWYNESLKDSELFTSEYTTDIMNSSEDTFTNRINEIVLSVVTSVAKVLWYTVRSVFNIMLALFIAIYYLLIQRKLVRNTMELTRLKWGTERANSVINVIKEIDKVFGKYISAKLVQAFIIFCTAQIIFIILDVPLSTLLAVILAICNIVPYIGAIIGIIPPIVLSLIDDPTKGLWVVIAMLILQLADGNVLQPVLIGDKLDLKPFWVIVVVILGGNWFGLTGILLSVPVAAVISIFIKKYIKKQKRKSLNNQTADS